MIFKLENEELLLLSSLTNLNAEGKDQTFKTVCPHDCPSACGLEIVLDQFGAITGVRGGQEHSYTDGVICAKVARYKELSLIHI